MLTIEEEICVSTAEDSSYNFIKILNSQKLNISEFLRKDLQIKDTLCY